MIGGFPPLVALWSLVARGQAIDTQVPGVLFQYGSGWWEYDFYIGALAALVLVVGLVAARRVWPLAAVGVVFLLLSLDWPERWGFLNLWEFVQDWPILRSHRAPSRWLALALFAFILCAGVGLQRLWVSAALTRHRRLAMAVMIALVAVIAVDLQVESRGWQRIAVADTPLWREHRPPVTYTTRAGALASSFWSSLPTAWCIRFGRRVPSWLHSRSSGSSTTNGRSRASPQRNIAGGWPCGFRRADTSSRCAFDPASWVRESRSVR